MLLLWIFISVIIICIFMAITDKTSQYIIGVNRAQKQWNKELKRREKFDITDNCIEFSIKEKGE